MLPLSIVLRYCPTKTPDLTFIGCHHVRLQSCSMVVMMSVRAPSRVSSHIRYINPYVRRHFFICGHGIFPSLRRAVSYPLTTSAYDSRISFPFSFVSTMRRHFFLPFSSVSTLYPIPSPSVSRAGFFDSLSSRRSPCWTRFFFSGPDLNLIIVSERPRGEFSSRRRTTTGRRRRVT